MEPLCDPLNDRNMKTVRPPPHRPLARQLIWPNKNNSNNARQRLHKHNFT